MTKNNILKSISLDSNMVFKQFLQQHPQTKQQKWLVAVSGGMDSVLLSWLCFKNQIPFGIAHCNFNLRAEESLRDRTFVEKLAGELQVPFYVKDFDTNSYIAETGKSVQVAARELRYQWFQELAKTEGYRFIATAHHSDDNAETVLMHLFRGSGIKGLRGMLPVQGNIIRPLLHASKEMIKVYAEEYRYKWVDDSSNESDKYTRNHIRHHALAAIKTALPNSDAGFEKTISLLTDTEILYNEAITLHKKKLAEIVGNEIHIPVLKLQKLPAAKTILYEISSSYGFTAAQLDDTFHLLQSESGKYVASPTHRIIRNRAWLIITPQKTVEAANILIEGSNQQLSFQQGTLQLQTISVQYLQLTDDANTALLDAVDIVFPLLLRPWKPGDYFYPLGMRKKKKLSRFFTDRKLSKPEKEKIWVIESGKKILWVIGQRIDDRFKIEKNTGVVLKITIAATAGASVD